MRPIAALHTELRITALVLLVTGAAGLAGAIARELGVVEALVAALVIAVLVAAVHALVNHRWLRAQARSAPRAGEGVRVEERRLTVRRTLVGLAPAVVLIAGAVGLAPGVAAPLCGMLLGFGAVDLAGALWAERRRRETGDTLYRELGGSPFAGVRRPLYTRPM